MLPDFNLEEKILNLAMSSALSGQRQVDLWENMIKEFNEKQERRPMCLQAIPDEDKRGGAIDTGMILPKPVHWGRKSH